ncbi:GrpE-domain-containing protein [Phellopilus nigrolimitatus]|nr:GrpE-domain-containing protein [Phellopilus nigrolimitatus]
MSRAQAFSFLRQCSASLSPATSSRRTAAARSFRARPCARTYSTQGKQKETDSAEAGKKEPEASSSEGSSADPAAAAAAECTKKLTTKEAEVVDLTSRLRYLQADFLNLQRNASREKEQTKDFAITRFASDLLETVDVLSLALKSIPDAALKPPAADSPSTSEPTSPPSASSSSSTSTPTKSAQEYLVELHHGVEMTHRQLLQTLFKFNVKPFDPTGDAFDPNRHEALYQAPIPGKTPGTVIQCQKIGFTIKDRTLRAAQVGVAAESS